MEYNVNVPPIQPTVTLKFKSLEEALNLLSELRQWNSHHRSTPVLKLLIALEHASKGTTTYSAEWSSDEAI